MHGSVNLPRSNESVMGLCFNHPYVLQPCFKVNGIGSSTSMERIHFESLCSWERNGTDFFCKEECSSNGYFLHTVTPPWDLIGRKMHACFFFSHFFVGDAFGLKNAYYKTWVEVERVCWFHYTNFTSEKHKENMEQKAWTSNGWELTMLPGKTHLLNLQITMLLGSRSIFFQRCVVFTNNVYIHIYIYTPPWN